MTEKWTAQEFVRSDWEFTSDANGKFSHEQIASAGIIQLGLEVQGLRRTMEQIRYLMLQLGNDGLHEVIREHARITNVNIKKRKARAKKARAKLRRVA